MTVADTLAEAIAAARAGRRDEARAALLQVLEADDRNEQAWLWLTGVMDAPEDRRVCLENVLTINPDNAHARRGLALLNQQHPPPAAPPTVQLPAAPPTVQLPTPPQPPAGDALVDAVIAITATPAAPLAASPVTTATVKLADAAPAPASPPREQPPPATAAPDVEEPCPYCGAVTLQRQRACPSCHRRLMVRQAVREHRSVALTIMAALYALGAVGALVGGCIVILAVVGLSALASTAGQDLPPALVGGLIGGVVAVVAITVATTVGLFRRRRWAYIAHICNLFLTALLTVAQVVFAGAFAAMLIGVAGEVGDPAAEAELMGAAGSVGGTVIWNIVVLALWIVLTVLSHRDFYGPMARMTSAGIDIGADAFNAGIRFRDAGMWYMAAHAWERAAGEAPKDATVHHALGMAYARLKRYDQSVITLRAAHQLQPANPQLAADLALVERLAAGAAAH